MNQHGDQIAELYALIKQLQEDNNNLRTTFAAGSHGASAGHNAEHGSGDDPGWLASPDTTIIRGHSADLITCQSFID